MCNSCLRCLQLQPQNVLASVSPLPLMLVIASCRSIVWRRTHSAISKCLLIDTGVPKPNGIHVPTFLQHRFWFFAQPGPVSLWTHHSDPFKTLKSEASGSECRLK